jgi:uncharacterized protein (DUF934 family)
MGALIVRQTLPNDHWNWSESDAPIAFGTSVVVPLAYLLAKREWLSARTGELGVILQPDDDPLLLGEHLDALALIAVNFPVFTDGRGYSSARLIRERLNWRGELRAVGDIQRDQISYLFRVGFDAFALKPGQDPNDALRAIEDFSDGYQASVVQPLPLFRRRHISVTTAVSD